MSTSSSSALSSAFCCIKEDISDHEYSRALITLNRMTCSSSSGCSELTSNHLLYLYRSHCHLQLSLNHVSSEMMNAALDDACKAISLCPDSAQCYLQAGIVLMVMNRFGKAEEMMRKAISYDPSLESSLIFDMIYLRFMSCKAFGHSDEESLSAAIRFVTIKDCFNFIEREKKERNSRRLESLIESVRRVSMELIDHHDLDICLQTGSVGYSSGIKEPCLNQVNGIIDNGILNIIKLKKTKQTINCLEGIKGFKEESDEDKERDEDEELVWDEEKELNEEEYIDMIQISYEASIRSSRTSSASNIELEDHKQPVESQESSSQNEVKGKSETKCWTRLLKDVGHKDKQQNNFVILKRIDKLESNRVKQNQINGKDNHLKKKPTFDPRLDPKIDPKIDLRNDFPRLGEEEKDKNKDMTNRRTSEEKNEIMMKSVTIKKRSSDVSSMKSTPSLKSKLKSKSLRCKSSSDGKSNALSKIIPIKLQSFRCISSSLEADSRLDIKLPIDLNPNRRKEPTNILSLEGVWVSHLRSSVKITQIIRIFGQFGLITDLIHPQDETFAFIHYDNPESPIQAMTRWNEQFCHSLCDNQVTRLCIKFIPTHRQKEWFDGLKINEYKEMVNSLGDCDVWRSKGKCNSIYGPNRCPFKHEEANKKVDMMSWC